MYLFIILKKCFIHNKGDILKIRQHWLGHRNYNHTKSSSRIFSLRLCLMHWHFAEVYVITPLHMAIKIVIDLPWIHNTSKMYKTILEFSLILCAECLDIFNIYLNGSYSDDISFVSNNFLQYLCMLFQWLTCI